MNSESMSLSSNERLLVFDLDGTLYELDAASYSSSSLSEEVESRKRKFFEQRLGVEDVDETLSQLQEDYGEDTSLAVEGEYGIDRTDYFDFVWDVDPEGIIETHDCLEDIMELEGRKAILTTAPRIWANRVIESLGIRDNFEYLQTGEPDHRKPLKDAYWHLLDEMGAEPEQGTMIGDQENHDIIPASEIGMQTVYVGGESGRADYNIDNLEELVDVL